MAKGPICTFQYNSWRYEFRVAFSLIDCLPWLRFEKKKVFYEIRTHRHIQLDIMSEAIK